MEFPNGPPGEPDCVGGRNVVLLGPGDALGSQGDGELPALGDCIGNVSQQTFNLFESFFLGHSLWYCHNAARRRRGDVVVEDDAKPRRHFAGFLLSPRKIRAGWKRVDKERRILKL